MKTIIKATIALLGMAATSAHAAVPALLISAVDGCCAIGAACCVAGGACC